MCFSHTPTQVVVNKTNLGITQRIAAPATIDALASASRSGFVPAGRRAERNGCVPLALLESSICGCGGDGEGRDRCRRGRTTTRWPTRARWGSPDHASIPAAPRTRTRTSASLLLIPTWATRSVFGLCGDESQDDRRRNIDRRVLSEEVDKACFLLCVEESFSVVLFCELAENVEEGMARDLWRAV
jgi:hypothetical protein